MGKLIYTGITSLDGYIADEAGNFDWSVPDEEVHAFVNDLERPIGTHLYGRRLYEVMRVWQTMPVEGSPAEIADYAQIWRAADKIVYSNSLAEVSTPKTRLERGFDPADIRALKQSEERDLSIGGPGLAASAIEAGLVDEFAVFVSPVVVGGGTRYLPDRAKLGLELVDERRFGNGVVYLSYRALSA
ncbi:dihydrofolate reductase family protein [Conyzicola nivalis]|uniref:Deaminase n=1 Tax=Conyzicola nivalis TaxID=1477021 RepID=A0A916SLZ2_9MICO|nr:dihydrofolate reductase family protein [Conyzicola nivalis]GGB06789.1 deaminase [Conyzicola nivalis]